MSQPSVTLTELDGSLGILPPTEGKLLALVGVCSSGPVDTPATFARVTDIVAIYGHGPLVEAAAHYIGKFGRPVLIVRTGQTTLGSFPAGAVVVRVGAGTSVITVDNAGTAPWDDYEFAFKVVVGGTIGAAGITFQWSLDGGRTYSAVTALGTATSWVFPDSGGAAIDFAAGTLIAAETATFRGDAPLWNGTEIGTALDALFASIASWETVEIVGTVDGTSFDAINPKFTAADTAGKYRGWVGHCRMEDLGESQAAYLIAMNAIFSSKATVHGELCAAAAKVSSGVSGRTYRRPVSFLVGALEGFVSAEVNIAEVARGPIQGASIRDANGNADEHDESLNPGLDDARFTVLRTHEDFQGVYVNRARVFSANGSDFDLYTKRRVMNIAKATVRSFLAVRLNKPLFVNAATGFILEEEALEIESGAEAAMRSALNGKASGVAYVLSRTDNILSTKTLNGSARVVPLAYVEFIESDVGFTNPALSVQSA